VPVANASQAERAGIFELHRLSASNSKKLGDNGIIR